MSRPYGSAEGHCLDKSSKVISQINKTDKNISISKGSIYWALSIQNTSLSNIEVKLPHGMRGRAHFACIKEIDGKLTIEMEEQELTTW